MLGLGYATRFRRRISGAAMIASPLIGLASVFVGPGSESTTAAQLTTIAAHRDAFLASVLLGLVALVLLIPAVLGIAHPLRARAVAIGNIGGGLALAGVVGLASLNALGLMLYEMTGGSFNRGEMVDLAEGVESNPVFVVMLVTALVGLGLGMLLLTGAAARAGLAPPWVPILIAAAIGLGLLGHTKLIQVVFFVLLILALGRIGIRVMTLSDDAWESGRLQGQAAGAT